VSTPSPPSIPRPTGANLEVEGGASVSVAAMPAAPRLLPTPETMPSRRRSRLVLVAALTVGACGAAGPASQAPGTAAPVEAFLDGGWIVEEEAVAPGGNASVVGRVHSVAFDTAAAAVVATTGCRRIIGSYTIGSHTIGSYTIGSHAIGSGPEDRPEPDGSPRPPEGGPATFTVPGRSTEECPEGDDLAAEAFTELLEQVEQWRREGDRLILEGPRGSVVLLPGD
jgi:heat shock protein HslJ